MCYEVTFTVHFGEQFEGDNCPDLSYSLEIHSDDLQALSDCSNLYNTDPAVIIQSLLNSGFRLVKEAAIHHPIAESILGLQIAMAKQEARMYDISCDICERKAVAYSKPREDQLSICDQCARRMKKKLGRKEFQDWAKRKWNEKQHSLRTPKL